jgi:hypothetical protein
MSMLFKEKEYGPWPSIVCIVLTAFALMPAYFSGPNHALTVILTDAYLLGVVFLFRAFKRLQKWNAKSGNAKSTFRFAGVPSNIKKWVVACLLFCLIAFVLDLLSPWIIWPRRDPAKETDRSAASRHSAALVAAADAIVSGNRT